MASVDDSDCAAPKETGIELEITTESETETWTETGTETRADTGAGTKTETKTETGTEIAAINTTSPRRLGVLNQNAPWHVQLDRHIYSLQHRPPATSPLVRDARSNLLGNAHVPDDLASALAACSEQLRNVGIHVIDVNDTPLENLFTQVAVLRTRLQTRALRVLHLTRMAAMSVLNTQSHVFNAIIQREATEALVYLTRADDVALRIEQACHFRRNNDNVSATTTLSKSGFAQVHTDAMACEKRLARAKQEATLRLESIEEEFDSAKKRYDETIDGLHTRAIVHKKTASIERKSKQRALMTGTAIGVAKTLICICGKKCIEALARSEQLNKQTEAAANASKLRIVDEKTDLRRMLRVHANVMTATKHAAAEERRRIMKYTQAATSARNVAKLLEELDEMKEQSNGDRAIEIATQVRDAVSSLRIQGSQMAATILDACSKDKNGRPHRDITDEKEKVEDDNGDQMYFVSFLLLKYYAGWAAVADYCGECTHHVNEGGGVGARRISYQARSSSQMFASTPRNVVGSSSEPQVDKMSESVAQLDALIEQIKIESQAEADDSEPFVI